MAESSLPAAAKEVHDLAKAARPDALVVGVAVDADSHARHPEVGLGARPFELGSITKTFTATALAALVIDGRCRLDDPIGRWVNAAEWSSTTLEELATHSSGLPRLAPNHGDWAGFDPADPYAGFTAEMAEAGLAMVSRPPARTVVYSNYGYQLLGLAIERIAGRPYLDVLIERVAGPLNLTSLALRSPAIDIAGRRDGQPVKTWSQQLPGSGGLVLSAGDFARYLHAVVRPPAGRVGDAIKLAVAPRRRIAQGRDIALAWHLLGGVVFHNGATAGSSSAAAIDPAQGRGRGALAADATLASVLDAAVLGVRPDPRPGARRPTTVLMGSDGLLNKQGAFAAVCADGDRLLVKLEEGTDTWFELVRFEDFEAAALISKCQELMGQRWLKRLSEDLDDIFDALGRPLPEAVTVTVKPANGDAQSVEQLVPLTVSKRKAAARFNHAP